MPGNDKLLDKTEFLLEQETEFLCEGQPRSQSSSAKIDVTSPVNLIGNFACSVPSLSLAARFARIARVGLGTRLCEGNTAQNFAK